jgi:hypothetical protein
LPTTKELTMKHLVFIAAAALLGAPAFAAKPCEEL